MKTQNNEPAFPCTTGSDGGIMFAGVSKRELFSAMMFQGMIARRKFEEFETPGAAETAIEYADALLKQLKEGE